MANEKRLIDRNEIFPNGTFFASAEDPLKSLDELIKRIWSIPTVDAVELPCKVGDMVYRKDGAWNVVGFECDRGGSWKVKLERWKDWFRDYHESTKVSFKSFGKTVFLTREEAESALAKMDGDGNG